MGFVILMFVKSFENNSKNKYFKLDLSCLYCFKDRENVLFILIDLYEPDFN